MKHQKTRLINALWQKKIIWLMVLPILIIPFVSSTFMPSAPYSLCVQEFANVSTSCGGLNTGNYNFQTPEVWTTPEHIIDGLYGTSGYASTDFGTESNLTINYTIPERVQFPSIWEEKSGLGSGTAVNMTNLDNCIFYSNTTLVLRISSGRNSGGSYYRNFYCMNSNGFTLIYSGAGNSHTIFEETMIWNISKVVENEQSFIPEVPEFKNTQFSLNMTYDSSYYSSISATLTYNNTNYTGIKEGNGNNIKFSSSVISPSVSSKTNVTFFWSLTLNNGTNYEYYNTNYFNQSVINLNFGLCNASNQVPLFNFTQKDEITRNKITLGTYGIQLSIGNSQHSNYQTILANASNVNSFALCLNTSVIDGLRVDYILQYTSSGYSSEFYVVQNYTLNSTNIGKNITLYPIINSNYTNFILKVKDDNLLSVSNAVVEIYRKYVDLGDYILVESPITDSLGQAIGHLQKNDVLYKIVIRKDNAILYQFDDIQVYCNEVVSDCILNLQFRQSSFNPDGYINYKDLSFTPTYDYNSRTYRITFSSISGSSKKIDVYGFLLKNYQNQSVCSNTITASSGILDCVISGTFENQTILINAYVDNELLFVDYVSAGYKKSDILGNTRYILLAFMIPLFVMFALSSGSLAIVFYFIGLIFGIGIYSLNGSLIGAGSFFIWLLVAGVILIIKIMKGGIKNG